MTLWFSGVGASPGGNDGASHRSKRHQHMRNEKNLGSTVPYIGMMSYPNNTGIYFHKPWNKDPYELMNQPSISMESIQLSFLIVALISAKPPQSQLKERWKFVDFHPRVDWLISLEKLTFLRLLSMWPSYGSLVIYLENIGITYPFSLGNWLAAWCWGAPQVDGNSRTATAELFQVC